METVAFNKIGFHTQMILNRLINERQIKEHDADHEGPGDERDSSDKTQRADLANIEREKKRRAIRG